MCFRICIPQSLADRVSHISFLDLFVHRTDFTFAFNCPHILPNAVELEYIIPTRTTEITLAPSFRTPSLPLLFLYQNLNVLFIKHWLGGQSLFSWNTAPIQGQHDGWWIHRQFWLCPISKTFLTKSNCTQRFNPTQNFSLPAVVSPPMPPVFKCKINGELFLL